jgi:hypothetical protein
MKRSGPSTSTSASRENPSVSAPIPQRHRMRLIPAINHVIRRSECRPGIFPLRNGPRNPWLISNHLVRKRRELRGERHEVPQSIVALVGRGAPRRRIIAKLGVKLSVGARDEMAGIDGAVAPGPECSRGRGGGGAAHREG